MSIRIGARTPNKMPLTQKDLLLQGCSAPDCDHTQDEVLFIQASCHQYVDGVIVEYSKKTGTMTFSCPECGNFLGEYLIAREL